MTSLKPPENLKGVISELNALLQAMEDSMITPPNDINSQIEHLSTIGSILAMQGRVMELATGIHSHMKGVLFEQLDKPLPFKAGETALDYKATEQKFWAEGQMATWEALYVKSERMIKSLDKYCENLRTIISAEKELRKI